MLATLGEGRFNKCQGKKIVLYTYLWTQTSCEHLVLCICIKLLSRTVCNITTLMPSCLLSLTTVVFVDAQSSKNKDTLFALDSVHILPKWLFSLQEHRGLRVLDYPLTKPFCHLTVAAQPSNSACLPVEVSSRWYPTPFYNPVFPFYPLPGFSSPLPTTFLCMTW